MAPMGEAVCRGAVHAGGWVGGGQADRDPLTRTRWVTVRGDIAPYLF